MCAHRLKPAPAHRPPVPPKNHPFKLVLAYADAMMTAWGISRQKATLLATALFFAEGVEPIDPADLQKKMRRVFDENGGFAMVYTLPASGTPDGKNIKEKMQAVDTLNKMDKRYSKGDDLEYRTALSTLVYLAMFVQGRVDERHVMINALLHALNDSDPQVQKLGALLLK
jgi:hypothetical protein